MLAAAALGSVVPRFSFYLVLPAPLAKLQSTVGGAVTEGPVLVVVATLFQSVLHSVEGVHLLSIFFRAKSGGIILRNATLHSRLRSSTLTRTLGCFASFRMSVTDLLPNTVMHSLINNLLVTLLSISGQTPLQFRIDPANRFAYTLEVT